MRPKAATAPSSTHAPAGSPTAIATHYTGLLVRHLMDDGYGEAELLRDSGVSAERLADPHAAITFNEHRRIVLNALRITGNPALGIWFGKQLKLASLGLVGYAAMSSPTLGEAAVLISRFYALRTQHLELHVEAASPGEGRPAPTLRFDETRDYGDIRVFLIESVLQCVSDLSAMFLGAAPDSLSFDVTYPEPAHWVDVHFPHPVRFGQAAHRIHVGRSALAAPLPNADPGTAGAILALLEAQLDARTSAGPLQQRVRRVLTESFRSGRGEFPDGREVAEQLGCSARTLRRDLHAQGTSYRALADEVRCRLAIESLQGDKLSVAELGARLGYRDTANFRRAFKRWTGRLPSEYRAGVPLPQGSRMAVGSRSSKPSPRLPAKRDPAHSREPSVRTPQRRP